MMKNNLTAFESLIYALLILPFISMMNLQAQDYLITFTGTGASTDVTTVKVENLTQAKQLEINGTDILHLKAVVTGIETIHNSVSGKIDLYPNPTKDYVRMQFILPEPGETLITIHDLSGRKIAQKQDLLAMGQQTYLIHGIEQGMYFVMVNSGRFDFKGRLISLGSGNSGIRIVYENTLALQEKQTDIKGVEAEVVMLYNTGDRLKLTGISGIYSTVITDIPDANKTITFSFIPCTDGDGTNYPVLQIGSAKGTTENFDNSEGKGIQIWMTENLRTSKYNDGTVIPNVTDNIGWSANKTGAYCIYDNNPVNNTIYGKLYNWHVVSSANPKNVCPVGWHVPSDTEWNNLTTYLGGQTLAGGKLKETGTGHWKTPNTGASDETGFTALPGGNRYYAGPFLDKGDYGYWWSSTAYSTYYAWHQFLGYNTAFVWQYGAEKEFGFSVRCLKN